MTVITGDLILVTDRPSAVTEVWIRAGEIRTHDGGLVLEDRDREPIHDGWLEINVLPGPAILTLVSQGTVRKAVPIVVPDAEATSLEDAVNAAKLAQPSLKAWLEELAAAVLAGTKGPKGDRGPQGRAGSDGITYYTWVKYADSAAGAGMSDDPAGKFYMGIAANKVTSTASTNPADYTWSRIKGDQGLTGTLDLIDESVQTTIDTVVTPAIESARDEALGQVSGAVAAEVDQIKWVRRELLDEHLDTITQPGAYGVSQPLYITAANGYPRTTGVEYGVTLQVMRTNPANPNTYQQELTYTDGEKWTRSRYGAHTWSQWSSPTTAVIKYRGVLTADMNIDNLRFQADDGPWRVLGAAIAQTLGLPDPGAGDFSVRWIAGSGSPYAVQQWTSVTTGVQWSRAHDSYRWTAWTAGPPTAPEKPAPPMTAEARRDQLIASRGGRIGTGGRGVVAFRFDHNVRPFQEKVLPLLRARGLPGSMAHFVDEMTPQPGYSGSDEVGKTWADVTTQFFQGIEVWSHSWSHTDAATEQTLQKEIVDSRVALESRIPEASVVGWMQPGMLGSHYMGYGDVFSSPELHGTTRAGQLVEATYGADDRSGTITSLPGSRHFGCLWIDTATSALATTSAIDEAARTGLGVVISLHPSQVDATGGISTATLTAILDHVVALRDQGKIMVLSVGGMTVADAASEYRQILTPALPSWSGWTTTPEGGKSGTPSSGTLTTSFSLGNHPYLRGHLRELVVTATGTGTITMRVMDRTGVSALDVSRTLEVSGDVTAHLPFGIARTNNGVRVELTCTAGAVTVRDARIQSI